MKIRCSWLAYDRDGGPGEVEVVKILGVEVTVRAPDALPLDLDEEGLVRFHSRIIRWQRRGHEMVPRRHELGPAVEVLHVRDHDWRGIGVV